MYVVRRCHSPHRWNCFSCLDIFSAAAEPINKALGTFYRVRTSDLQDNLEGLEADIEFSRNIVDTACNVCFGEERECSVSLLIMDPGDIFSPGGLPLG